MSGRTLVSVVVLVMLAVPSAAVAKGVQDAQVCGASGCSAAPLNADTYLVFEGGPTAPPPAQREPFYELRYRVMEGHGAGPEAELASVRTIYLPGARLLRGEDGTWMHADSRASEAMRRHLTGVEPFPAAKLQLPGVRDTPVPASREDAGSASGGGPDVLPLVGLGLLAAGGALAVVGSRRRRGPAAG